MAGGYRGIRANEKKGGEGGDKPLGGFVPELFLCLRQI